MPTRLLYLLIAVIVFSSCEKQVTLGLPIADNKPILNLLMNKDSMIMARVTLSARINEYDGVPEVKNADVNLYEDGIFKEKLMPIVFSGRTWYHGNTLAKVGATYRVTAAVPDHKEVAGSDLVPDTVAIEEIKYNLTQEGTTINVQLRDDPAVQNYYRVRLFSYGKSANNNMQKYQSTFETQDATVDFFNDKERLEFYTTDALFNGRSPRFVFKTEFNQYSIRNNYSLIIEITSLTYNSYSYLNSAFMAQEKNDDPLSEKAMVFNNIENGLGIVGGVAQREYVVIP